MECRRRQKSDHPLLFREVQYRWESQQVNGTSLLRRVNRPPSAPSTPTTTTRRWIAGSPTSSCFGTAKTNQTTTKRCRRRFTWHWRHCSGWRVERISQKNGENQRRFHSLDSSSFADRTITTENRGSRLISLLLVHFRNLFLFLCQTKWQNKTVIDMTPVQEMAKFAWSTEKSKDL